LKIISISLVRVAAHVANAAGGGHKIVQAVILRQVNRWRCPATARLSFALPYKGMRAIAFAAQQVHRLVVCRKSRRVVQFIRYKGAVPFLAIVFKIAEFAVFTIEPGGIAGIIEFLAVVRESNPVQREGRANALKVEQFE
jgi:hypothetical protein